MTTHFIRLALVAVVGTTIGTTASAGQTMTPKYDQKCLDDAGLAYISCMKDAKTEVAKNQCGKSKVEAEKRCKK